MSLGRYTEGRGVAPKPTDDPAVGRRGVVQLAIDIDADANERQADAGGCAGMFVGCATVERRPLHAPWHPDRVWDDLADSRPHPTLSRARRSGSVSARLSADRFGRYGGLLCGRAQGLGIAFRALSAAAMRRVTYVASSA